MTGGILIIILYFLIGLLATTIGAMTGIGGGVIIKPVLDAFGHYDVATISALSSATVLAMAVVSLAQNMRLQIPVNWHVSTMLSFGSIIGGIIGKSIFNQLLELIGNGDAVTVVQAGLLILLLVVIFIYNNKEITTYELKSTLFIFVVGMALGFLASFLGIGGGPLNVAILSFAFSMNIKTATINSIFIIFFSQSSTLITIAVTTGYESLDLSMLGYMIIGGIMGGFVGSTFVKRVRNKQVELLFNIALLLIISINIFTILRIYIGG